MPLSRMPEKGERGVFKLPNKNQKGDEYLLEHEGQIGEVERIGSEHAPHMIYVRLPYQSLLVLVSYKHLRTTDGDSFKPS